MAETSFTPGPWAQNRWGEICDANGDRIIASGLGLATGTWPDDTPKKNAHLIAAAPELYSTNERAACALLDLVNILRESDSWDQAFLDEVEAEARASFSALAKARGEAA